MRNDAEWGELFDLPVFQDSDAPCFLEAWKWAQELQQGGRLSRTDIFALQCLLDGALATAHPAPASNTTSVGEVERVARAIRESWEPGGSYETVARAALAAMPTSEAIRADERGRVVDIEAAQSLLDRLVDHEIRMTSDEDAREWFGHVTPAMARLRAALNPSARSE